MTTMQIQNTVEMTELSRVLLNTLQVILQNDWAKTANLFNHFT